MATLDRANLIEGTRLRVGNGERKQLDLLADGTLVVIAAFDGFLSWGSQDVTEDPKVHGLALIEFVYEFVALYSRILEQYVDPHPKRVRFQVGIQSAVFADGSGAERALYLRPGPITDLPWPRQAGAYEAPASEFARQLDADVGEGGKLDVAGVALLLVREFYNWFGHTDDAIPYTLADPPGIDIEAIKALS